MSKCNNYAFNSIGFGPIDDIYPTPFGGVADCSNYYGLLWWAVWLEFICIALSTLLALRFIWPKVDAAFTLTVYFFMMSSILLFSVAYAYTTSVYVSASKNSGSFSFTSGTSLVCAGSIGVSLPKGVQSFPCLADSLVRAEPHPELHLHHLDLLGSRSHPTHLGTKGSPFRCQVLPHRGGARRLINQTRRAPSFFPQLHSLIFHS
jgi:hypothetical protein